MGRVKLKIKRLDNSSSRQMTYSKRKAGVMKKAMELSILCDIDLVLLMFAPNGKPSVCVGDRSKIEEVVSRFAQVSEQERTKRKLENLEALKKTFQKLDHDINIHEFLGSSTQTAQVMSNHLGFLRDHLLDVQERLSYWADPDNIANIDHITAMEQSLKVSLGLIQMQKVTQFETLDYNRRLLMDTVLNYQFAENLGKQHVSVDCSGKFQNGTHLPTNLGGEQGDLQASSFLNNDAEQLMFAQATNWLTPRDIGFSGDTSLQNYGSYFDTVEPANPNEQAQEDYLYELCLNSGLRVQLGEQNECRSNSENFLHGRTFVPDAENSLPQSTIDHYQVNHFDACVQNCASPAGSCGVAVYDEHSFTQQQPD